MREGGARFTSVPDLALRVPGEQSKVRKFATKQMARGSPELPLGTSIGLN